jgi:HPt (histidine-containing phosphotransfer) domain-containing protein
MTAQASGSSEPECLSPGMSGFVTKPLHPALLFAEMASVSGGGDGMPAPEPIAPEFPPPEADMTDIPDADLLDEEQVSLLLEVLTADDWSASIAGFTDNGRKTIDAMIAQARAGEPHDRTAHTLKGTSLNLGAAALGQLAKELEHAPAAAVLEQEKRLYDLLDRSVAALATRRPINV